MEQTCRETGTCVADIIETFFNVLNDFACPLSLKHLKQFWLCVFFGWDLEKL